ncbi:MAG TPA: NADH-quinone oxidoreductase subunit H [Elusimicrobiales bacterium]|nr:NADH-quinone oxidoreductase subunit H [Elusimicrobiales bacterium]
MESLIPALTYLLLAPLAGGLLAGVDRIVSARMQRRVGPPLLQPFYDVAKLFSKGDVEVNGLQYPLALCHLVFMALAGALFFAGGDLLLVIFVFTVAALFLVAAAFSSASPYSFVGAERELIIILAAEPALLIAAAAIYKVAGSLSFLAVAASGTALITRLPGVFLCLVYVLTMKLRKSPFDLSYSHHAHQEIVKGITTDLGGRSLAFIELTHWYENIFLMGLVYLFFAFSLPLGLAAVALTYFLEVLADNTNARVRWQLALSSTWGITLLLAGGNLLALYALGAK